MNYNAIKRTLKGGEPSEELGYIQCVLTKYVQRAYCILISCEQCH